MWWELVDSHFLGMMFLQFMPWEYFSMGQELAYSDFFLVNRLALTKTSVNGRRSLLLWLSRKFLFEVIWIEGRTTIYIVFFRMKSETLKILKHWNCKIASTERIAKCLIRNFLPQSSFNQIGSRRVKMNEKPLTEPDQPEY